MIGNVIGEFCSCDDMMSFVLYLNWSDSTKKSRYTKVYRGDPLVFPTTGEIPHAVDRSS